MRSRAPRPLDPYGTLMANVLHPAWEGLVRRRPTLRYRALLESTQRSSLEEQRELQLRKLRRLVSHAYDHVPYYRDRFRAVGFEPGDLRSLDDLRALPVLTRDTAQETVAARTSTAPPFVAFRRTTGGTSGSALAFGYDEDAEWWREAGKLRSWGWAGYRVGARVFFYVGVHHGLHPPPGERLKTELERTLKRERYVGCMLRDEERLARAARALRRFRPDVIVTYPQAGADLARAILASGLQPSSKPVTLCHGERLFDVDRRVMQEAFGAAVYDLYAARETFMIASECDAHDGLHVVAENVFVEVLVRDGDTYREPNAGELGEVILTDLNNLGMPFIRYAIGDLAPEMVLERCACGRRLPRIPLVEGRTSEVLSSPTGERVSSLLFEQIMSNTIAPRVKQYQIVQRRDGSITFRVVPLREIDEDMLARCRRECRAMIKGVPVDIELVDALPPGPTGKRSVVIVERL